MEETSTIELIRIRIPLPNFSGLASSSLFLSYVTAQRGLTVGTRVGEKMGRPGLHSFFSEAKLSVLVSAVISRSSSLLCIHQADSRGRVSVGKANRQACHWHTALLLIA